MASNLQLDRLQQNGEAGGEIAADDETVPLVTRPGYIRFEPLGKSEAPYIHIYTPASPPPFCTHTSLCMCRVCPKIPFKCVWIDVEDLVGETIWEQGISVLKESQP